MSNPLWNKSTANSRDASGKKAGVWSDRGTADAPKAVRAGAITTKGIAPTSEGKASGGESFKISKGKVSGTMQSMGAAKKGGKYTWI
jgi:hypothetical protein|tara:strand:- start:157 stop:417 length:261 start_codon:yes stop_codon:yes gene_type:complete